MKANVLVLFNTPSRNPLTGAAAFVESDEGVAQEVAAVEAALVQLGASFRSAGAGSVRDLDALLKMGQESIVVNLVEALGWARRSCLPGSRHLSWIRALGDRKSDP